MERKKKSSPSSPTSVTFAVGTKTHDGLSPTSRLLQDLIKHDSTESTFTEKALVQFLKVIPQRARAFPSLIPRLHQLVVRLGSGSRSYVYVVPKTNGLPVPVAYFGRLVNLYRLCVNTFRRVREVYVKRRRSFSENDTDLCVPPAIASNRSRIGIKRSASADELIEAKRAATTITVLVPRKIVAPELTTPSATITEEKIPSPTDAGMPDDPEQNDPEQS